MVLYKIKEITLKTRYHESYLILNAIVNHLLGGNCSTAIPTGGNADSDSNESNGKGESDSDESGTPAPMSKKSRRDVYQARYSSAGGRDLDNSNSDEYAWSKTITRTIDRGEIAFM